MADLLGFIVACLATALCIFLHAPLLLTCVVIVAAVTIVPILHARRT